jgi:type I restriction enzyme S subunit
VSVVSQNRFKETRAGSVPADWDFVSIESIGEVITGRTPSTKVSEYYGGKYKLISPANLGESMYVTTAHKWLTEDGLSVSRVLPKDTVLVSCIGYIGKTGLTADDKSATNQQINAIKCNEKADPKFVFFLLTHLQNYLETFARVTTVPILNKTNFKSIEVPLPPLSEQRAIAHVLSTVRDAIEATERVIAAAHELKRSLMKHLFTYGPVPVDQAENVLLKETEIGDIPKEWDVAGFGSLVDIKSGQVDPREEPYWNMIHIGPENIEEATGRILSPRTAAELKLKSGKYLFTPEDVIYSKIRPYLRKAALPEFAGICSADMYPVHPKNDGLLSSCKTITPRFEKRATVEV